MKTFILTLAALVLVTGLVGCASGYPDQRADRDRDTQQSSWGQDFGGGHHWRRGERIGRNDWSGAQTVDYRRHNLGEPPRGYEWRESDGQYVLVAVATGLIGSIIIDDGR